MVAAFLAAAITQAKRGKRPIMLSDLLDVRRADARVINVCDTTLKNQSPAKKRGGRSKGDPTASAHARLGEEGARGQF